MRTTSRTQYMDFHTIKDAEHAVNYLKDRGFKAYYQAKNSCNYQVRYWRDYDSRDLVLVGLLH